MVNATTTTAVDLLSYTDLYEYEKEVEVKEFDDGLKSTNF